VTDATTTTTASASGTRRTSVTTILGRKRNERAGQQEKRSRQRCEYQCKRKVRKWYNKHIVEALNKALEILEEGK